MFDRKQIEKAVAAARQYFEYKDKNVMETNELFADTHETIGVCFLLMKTLHKQAQLKVKVKHHWVTSDTSVAIFVRDINKVDRTNIHRNRCTSASVDYYNMLFREAGINPIPKFYTIEDVNTDYTTPTSVRDLIRAHDRFLCDSRVLMQIRKPLKALHKPTSQKFPRRIELMDENKVKENYNEALKYINCVMLEDGPIRSFIAANSSLTDCQIADNIETVVKQFIEQIPGNESNIRCIYVSAKPNVLIPIYISYANPNDIQLPKEDDLIHLDPPDDTGVSTERVRVLQTGDMQYIEEGDTGFEEKYYENARKLIQAQKVVRIVNYRNPKLLMKDGPLKRKLGTKSHAHLAQKAAADIKNSFDDKMKELMHKKKRRKVVET